MPGWIRPARRDGRAASSGPPVAVPYKVSTPQHTPPVQELTLCALCADPGEGNAQVPGPRPANVTRPEVGMYVRSAHPLS